MHSLAVVGFFVLGFEYWFSFVFFFRFPRFAYLFKSHYSLSGMVFVLLYFFQGTNTIIINITWRRRGREIDFIIILRARNNIYTCRLFMRYYRYCINIIYCIIVIIIMFFNSSEEYYILVLTRTAVIYRRQFPYKTHVCENFIISRRLSPAARCVVRSDENRFFSFFLAVYTIIIIIIKYPRTLATINIRTSRLVKY